MITVTLPTFHVDQVRAFQIYRANKYVAGRCGRRWGKALALDTPLPTPSGWTTIGSVDIGDALFDENGNVCHVTETTDVMLGRPCNRVLFSDATEIVADDNHRWLTWDHAARKNVARNLQGGPKVRTTTEISDSLHSNERGDRNHSIPCTKELNLPHVEEFVIPPYVLGAWLGDGTAASSGFTCHPKDVQIIEEIRASGQTVQKSLRDPIGWCLTEGHTQKDGTSFKERARSIGVLGDKHIPIAYLRASVPQRLALLQGLMDTDGTANSNGRCELSFMNSRLAHDAHELALSLGIRAVLFCGRASIDGRDCGERYRVKFTTSKPVFRLLRKAEKIASRNARFNTEQRFIDDVVPIESVPVRCIAVDSESHLYLAGRAFIPTHNTDFAKTIAADYAVKGRKVGWFAPSYKIMAEAYNELVHILSPILPSRSGSSKTEGVIRTITGGQIDFWSLENERAGRSRRYHQVIVDEAAFAKETMKDIWDQAIEPTLLDYSALPYGGRCLMISNTNSVAEDNFFYMICETQREKYGFVQFHAPSRNNPYMPAASLARLEKEKHPLVWQQEYLAEFVDFSGISFFSRDNLLVDGQPAPRPTTCEVVLAVIDTAVKQGKEHDATAVSYWARMHGHFEDYALVCLDWDLISIDGAMLEIWMPSVFQRLEYYAKACGAVYGSAGAYIEDAASGSILLQQCALRNYPAEALPSELTAAGKDARAINASGPVWCGKVKFSVNAYEKTTTFKDTTRNHMLSQVSEFRVGDKEAAKRADDLLDTFTYAVAITLGNQEGIA